MNAAFENAYALFDDMLSMKMSDEEIERILIEKSTQTEQAADVAALAKVMRKYAKTVHFEGNCLDIVGTGGDGAQSFNISTASAIVCSLFINVAKHGNRAVSSKSGSADILEALGIKIEQTQEEVRSNLERKKFAFLFAPFYHQKLKSIMPIRKKIGKRTIFNLVGPLCNPINPSCQLIGVFKQDYLKIYLEAASILDIKNVAFVSSDMDEVSLSHISEIYFKKGLFVKNIKFDPVEFGIYSSMEHLKGFDAFTNAKLLKETFLGEHKILRDVISINAAFALLISEVESDLKLAFQLASESIQNKKAYEKLLEIQHD